MVSETPMMCTMSSGTGVSSGTTIWVIVVFIFLLSIIAAVLFVLWWILKKNKISQESPEKNEVQTKEKIEKQKRRVVKKK